MDLARPPYMFLIRDDGPNSEVRAWTYAHTNSWEIANPAITLLPCGDLSICYVISFMSYVEAVMFKLRWADDGIILCEGRPTDK